MARTLISALLAFASVLVFGAAAGPAFAAGGYYRAVLATPPAAGRLIVRDLIWHCGADGCVAGKSNSRVALDCAALARQAGALRSFSVEGRALSAEELEKCNARAR
jgi:hypothetical protein